MKSTPGGRGTERAGKIYTSTTREKGPNVETNKALTRIRGSWSRAGLPCPRALDNHRAHKSGILPGENLRRLTVVQTRAPIFGSVRVWAPGRPPLHAPVLSHAGRPKRARLGHCPKDGSFLGKSIFDSDLLLERFHPAVNDWLEAFGLGGMELGFILASDLSEQNA